MFFGLFDRKGKHMASLHRYIQCISMEMDVVNERDGIGCHLILLKYLLHVQLFCYFIVFHVPIHQFGIKSTSYT